MSSFITMLIGLAIGFTAARLMNNGYHKTATALFVVFVFGLMCYMGWAAYQIWAE